ncbi:hypothetical protein N7490_007256 [Penicillium lividum]|nr:hypothetical protein N7490_007256 [Penicillium lividum]
MINLITWVRQGQTGWIFLLVFVLVRIAGSADMLYVKTKSGSASIGAEVAVQVLYNISLGPLLAGTLSFVNNSISESEDQQHASSGRRNRVCQKNHSQRLRFAHLLIIAGLILGILGGIDRAPNSHTGQINPIEYNRGATYLKVASFLFLAVIIAISWGLASSWRKRNVMGKAVQYTMVAAAISLPFIFLRLIYSFLSVFSLNTTTSTGHSTTFNTLTGNWVAYLILVTLPQLVVVGVYNASGILGREGKDFTLVRASEVKNIP